MSKEIRFLKNDLLHTILPEWAGNPFDGKAFLYPHASFQPNIKDILRWQTTVNPQASEKKQDKWVPTVMTDSSALHTTEDFIVWLGHATFLVQIQGIRMITDPVLGSALGLSRIPKQPFTWADLGRIDLVLLSHDHRDHCDHSNLRQLFKNQNPVILTTLKMRELIRKWIPKAEIQEAAWYQQYKTSFQALNIHLLPSQHWCRRGLFDFNYRLWGSFMIQANDKTIYFGSDSAAGKHFTEIGTLFPKIDWALLGIGAYKPRYIMQKVHTNPHEAFEAFCQLNAKNMLPMHYGTFNLSDEPICEPYRLIQEVFGEASLTERLHLPAIGESLKL